MNHIPAGPAAGTTATPWIVVAKAVNSGIPHRSEMVDQELFRKSYPHRFNHEKTAAKLVQVTGSGGGTRKDMFGVSLLSYGQKACV